MEKNSEKKDRRIGKTKKSICDAIISLLEEKDVSQITVKELAERANINRKTFYMHYTSIKEVFDEIEDEFIEKLLGVLNKYNFTQAQLDHYAFFSSLSSLINEDFDFYQKLARVNSYDFLFVKIKKILKDKIVEELSEKLNASHEMFNLYAEFGASGIISMYNEWFNMDSNISLEDLAKAAGNFVFNGVNSIIEINNNTLV